MGCFEHIFLFLIGFTHTKNFSQVLLKACYFMKVGLVDLSTYGGKVKFEFLEIKIQILFSRHVYSSPQGRLS